MTTKTITLRTGSGIEKGTVELVDWTDGRLKTTHNGDTRFVYMRGWDQAGNEYETKSHGGGWRARAIKRPMADHVLDAYAAILDAAASATSDREVGRYVNIARCLMVPTGTRSRRGIAEEVRRAAGTSKEVWERGIGL